jgi:hypothetical protein
VGRDKSQLPPLPAILGFDPRPLFTYGEQVAAIVGSGDPVVEEILEHMDGAYKDNRHQAQEHSEGWAKSRTNKSVA